MNAVTPFLFEAEHLVRVTERDGEPWFVAKDVCDVLGYRMASDATRNLDDDEKGTHILRTPGGDQEVSVISESGLYALVFRSRKPQARRFRKWVTAEVLPSIRRTGGYAVGGVTRQRAVPVLGRSAATFVNLDLAEGFLGNRELRVLAALRSMVRPDGSIRADNAEMVRVTGLSYETISRAVCLFMCIGLVNTTYRKGLRLVPTDNEEYHTVVNEDGLQVLVPGAKPA